MTRREYLKYNNPTAYDMLGVLIKPGDLVVFNNYFNAFPNIGVVDHFTQDRKLAIYYNYRGLNFDKSQLTDRAYRRSRFVVKIKNGNKSNHKN